jgi:hypothetical protein
MQRKMSVLWDISLHSLIEFTEVSEVLTASIIRVMRVKGVSIPETMVNFYQNTWHTIPEDSHLHTCCSENLKSHKG